MNESVFKSWVPQWLAVVTIISVLFPSLVIFALYYNSTLAVSEYYSIDSMDIQYSVVLMYATVISYLALDSYLIKCFRLVNYTVAGIFVNTVTCWICASSNSGEIFMLCRFIQGAVCAWLCNICMTLSFTLFHVSKARVMGYTIFYGSLMICVPFSAIFANLILNYFGVESVFYGFILFQIPGFVLLLITMNNRYLLRKHPIRGADWQGFVIYTAIASILGYILVYGQQLEWLESSKIKSLILILLIITPVYIISSWKKKRPLIQLKLMKNGKYRFALLLLTIFYISKGTTFFTYLYMQDGLGIDPISMIRIWAVNIFGLFIGVLGSKSLLLKGISPRAIIKLGFMLLLVFHTQMYFLFAGIASEENFYIPLFVQGLGTGSLFVPLIMNMVMSVQKKQMGLVAFLGIGARFLGFCLAVALINFFQIYGTNNSYMDMAASYTMSNEMAKNQQVKAAGVYTEKGISMKEAQSKAEKDLSRMIKKEASLRAYMYYYSFIIGMIFLLLVYMSLDMFFSSFRKTISYIPSYKKLF